MNQDLPSVTAVIAARPGQRDIQSVAASRALDYPADKLEILVARGRQPSAQRNAAVRAARGDLIYFLDDDSVAGRGNLRRAVSHFVDASVKMVGGPNLCPADAPLLERVFALAVTSPLGFGPSRARYAQIGRPRSTTEKELILCNLFCRRDAFLELGGFNESLYPNEENALMDELVKRGGRLIYDPEIVVHRRPRPTLGAFARMLMTYGRGRAEQFRVNPTSRSALNFVPPAFCVYLATLPVLLAAAGSVWVLAPLALYVLAVLADGAHLARAGGWLALAAMPLVVLTHVLYGLGFWRGLFTKLRPTGRPFPGEIILEHANV